MVHVRVWRNFALLSLWFSCPEASVSIIERNVVPVTFVTAAATSDSEPIRLVLPMLLDVQPILLKVDVTRHVPAQIQSFCQEHGVDRLRCTGAIREALDDAVNFQRFCKKRTVENVLPGFVVTKNVIRSDGGATSGSWLQNDPQDVAIDFCSFAQAKTTVSETHECIEALGKSLHLSFDWILALTPCEQGSSRSHEEMTGDSEMQSVADRLATVEEMIAALQSNSGDEGKEELPMTEKPADDSSENFGDESGVDEEISEADEPDIVTTTVAVRDDNTEGVATESTGIKSNINQLHEHIYPDRYTVNAHGQYAELHELNGSETEVMAIDPTATELTKEKRIGESMGAGNGSCEAAYTTLQEEEPSRISEKQKSQKTWKVVAALVLALSITYLAIDLMIHCVQYVADRLGFPKQFARVQHDISLMAGRGASKDAYPRASGREDFKNPMFRQSSERKIIQSKYGRKSVETTAQKSSMKRRASAPAPHYHSPSFTCVAMMLMASRNDSILIKTENLPTSSLVHDCNEALTIIQKKYERELVAAQRIQKAWKAAQHRSRLGKFGTNAPIFRPIQLKTKPTEQAPRFDTGSTGLCRLVLNSLPPTA